MAHLNAQEQEVLGLLQQPHESRVKVDRQQLQLRSGLLVELQQGLVELLVGRGCHLVCRSRKQHRHLLDIINCYDLLPTAHLHATVHTPLGRMSWQAV